jgi:hypothetical protein
MKHRHKYLIFVSPRKSCSLDSLHFRSFAFARGFMTNAVAVQTYLGQGYPVV